MKHTRSHKFPVIILDLHENDGLLPFVAAQARKEGLRFLDVTQTNGIIPCDYDVIGVISRRPAIQRPYQHLLADDIPVIRTGTYMYPQTNTDPIVMSDIKAVGELAAEHFVSRGFRHVCYFGHDPWANPPVLFEGVEKQCLRLGCEVHLRRFTDPAKASKEDWSADRRKEYHDQQLKIWLKELPKPVGILSYGYKFAATIDITCESLGISVPGEVSILSAIDTPNCDYSYTPISAVDINCEEIARRAISSLKALMNGHELSSMKQLIPPAGVLLRKSSDVTAVDDPDVAKALSFIIRHLEWPISVEDVAEQVGVPRRRLAAAFKRSLGHNVNEDIRQRRLVRACELLSTTDMPISDITTAIGFSSKTYFHKIFLATYGITPHEYRQQ